MVPYGSPWFPMDLHGSLWFSMNLYCSLDLWFSMVPYSSLVLNSSPYMHAFLMIFIGSQSCITATALRKHA